MEQEKSFKEIEERLREIDEKFILDVKKMDLFDGVSEGEKFDILNPKNIGQVVLYKIKEITYEEEEKAPRREAFENVLGSLRDSFSNFLYIIIGDREKVSVYMGVVKNSYIDDKNKILELQDAGDLILKPSIEGNFRGSKIEKLKIDEKKEVLNFIQNVEKNKYAYFEGNPGINETDDKSDFQGIDRLIDIMSTGNDYKFGLVIYANPIQKKDILEIEKGVYNQYNYYNLLHKNSYQLGTNESTNTGKSIGITKGTSDSTTKGTNYSENEGSNTGVSKGTSTTETKGTSTNEGESNSITQGTGDSTGSSSSSSSKGTTKNYSTSKSIAEGKSKGTGTSNSLAKGITETENIGSSKGTTKGTSDSTTKGTSDSTTDTENNGKSEGTSKTTNYEVIRKEIQSWLTYIDETLLPMIDYGKSKGLFRVNSFILSENVGTLLKLGNTIKSLVSGKKGNKRTLEYYRLDNEKDKKMINNLVNFQMNKSEKNIEKEDFLYLNSVEVDKNNMINDFYSSKELSLIAGLPRKEVNGLKVTKQVEFGLNTVDEEVENPLKLGKMVQSGNIVENSNICIDKKDLNKHIFVAGVTGTGKTTTCQRILIESGMPFLVVEPAKTEYRIMKKREETKDILIFTLGQDNIAPFRLNPFEFFPHESLTSRVDMIKAAIEASFDMEAAIPQLIETTIYECYKDYGWDVNTNKNEKFENPFADDVYAFPTFTDILKKVEKVAEEQGFDERLKKDYIGSIKARLQSLTLGSKGMMLNTPRSIDFVDLLDKKVVLEIEEVKNTGEKSFVMGLIMTNLREALRIKYREDKNFKHITLIEEAHRLLSKFEAGDSINKKQGVEIFADMLAEVRKYGESLIIADQIPNKLTPEVLKNTNTKIIHKLFAEDDKESVGNTMILEKEQKSFLSSLITGRAVVFSQGWSKAVQVQIEQLTNTTSEEEVEEQELIDTCINYYKQNYKREIFMGSSALKKEPTFEEMKSIIQFSKSGIIFKFIKMYKKIMSNIRALDEETNESWDLYLEYKKSLGKTSKLEKEILIKYLKNIYLLDREHIKEENIEKNIREFIEESNFEEEVFKNNFREIRKELVNKLGKGDE